MGELEDRKFYTRALDLPVIRGTSIAFESQCYLCTLVKRLEQQGWSHEDAVSLEEDFYRMVYSFWNYSELSRWLESKGYKVSHDAIRTHIQKHIPDRHVAALERIRSYAAPSMNVAFMKTIFENLRLASFQFQQDLVEGRVEIKPRDYVEMMKFYRDWIDEVGADPEEQLTQALLKTVNRVFDSKEEKEQFVQTMREELNNLEQEES